MPLESPYDARVRSLLLDALAKADIPHRSKHTPRNPFSSTNFYWEDAPNDVVITYMSNRLGGGRLRCSLDIMELASRAAELFHDDQEATSALVDILDYLKTTISLILPMTHVGMIKRAENLYRRSVKPRSRLTDSAISALFEQMTPAFTDSREASEKRLRAERSRRGGSEPKLPEYERKSLHAQYDALHTVAKIIKKDYEAKLKLFAKKRAAKGYSHKEWRDHWIESADIYPDVFKNFVAIFAHEDRPSASDVAYIVLAEQTGHKRSYLPRLIADSRKSAKASTFKPQE